MGTFVKELIFSIEAQKDEEDSMSIQIPTPPESTQQLGQLPRARSTQLAVQNQAQLERWLHTKPALLRWGTRMSQRATQALAGHRWRVAASGEEGMATAEYAIATLAAVGFAAVLIAILKSGEVRGFLMAIIQHALSF